VIVIKQQYTLFFTKIDKTKINGTGKKNIKVFENKGKLGITENIGKLGESTKFEMRTQNKHINGLMFIGYNLSRYISVIGMEEFIKALKECCLTVFLIKMRHILRRFGRFLEKNVKLLHDKIKNFYAVKLFLFNPKDLYLYIN